VQKLKDARSEAAKEIEEYKSKKDAEYKKFESEVCISSHSMGSILLTSLPIQVVRRRSLEPTTAT
jgi:hypothetical protein